MFEMLAEIFATPSDKARLITILFSSVVAISIFILNQWYINKRNQKAIYIEKIEELYLASIDYVNAAQKLLMMHRNSRNKLLNTNELPSMEEGEKFANENRIAVLGMNNAIKKMEMLCGLYFPAEDVPLHEYGLKALPFIISSEHQDDYELGHYRTDSYKISLKHINQAEDALGHLCNKLMRKLSESILDKLRNKYRKICRQSVTQVKSKWNPL